MDKEIDLVVNLTGKPRTDFIPKPKVVKHITSINEPGVLKATVRNRCLMELSTGMHMWCDETDLVPLSTIN